MKIKDVRVVKVDHESAVLVCDFDVTEVFTYEVKQTSR